MVVHCHKGAEADSASGVDNHSDKSLNKKAAVTTPYERKQLSGEEDEDYFALFLSNLCNPLMAVTMKEKVWNDLKNEANKYMME